MGEAINWSPGVTLEAVEQQVIEKAFIHYQRNKSVTARSLGIAVRTLESRISAYEQQRADESIAKVERKQERDFQLQRARGIIPPTSERIRLEPSSDPSQESALSMHERGEVQKVLSDKAPHGSIRRKG